MSWWRKPQRISRHHLRLHRPGPPSNGWALTADEFSLPTAPPDRIIAVIPTPVASRILEDLPDRST